MPRTCTISLSRMKVSPSFDRTSLHASSAFLQGALLLDEGSKVVTESHDLRGGESCWLASDTNRMTSDPWPDEPLDVAIVGAGVMGAMLAERLTQQGWNVVILDRVDTRRLCEVSWRMRDLAIDCKLRGCDVVRFKIGDLARAAKYACDRCAVKDGRARRFELLLDARLSLLAWLQRRGGALGGSDAFKASYT